jgi:hypothetical protein
MEISVKEQTLNFNVKAIETFLGVTFEGSTMQDKEKFVAEYHDKRVETTTKLMQESYEDYIKE